MSPKLSLALLLVCACQRSDPLTLNVVPDPSERFLLDAGGSTPPPITPPIDAGASPIDAGSSEFESCDCPALGTCRQPTTDRPLFTPGDRPLAELFNLVACAESSLRIAIYDVELPCVVDALRARLDQAPNLTLDIIVDDERCPSGPSGRGCVLEALESHPRVSIVDDARSRYMHHKFAVADSAFVWVSSANLTERSLCIDENDAIVIEQPDVVAGFDAEITRLLSTAAYGPQPRVAPSTGGPFTARFGPQSPLSDAPNWHQALIAGIDGATQTITFGIFAFTRTDVSDALIAASVRGVAVRGTISSQYVHDTPGEALMAAGIPIRRGDVHSKLMVIDGRTVFTGSPNWSNNAWQNNEVSLQIADPAIAALYGERLDTTFDLAAPP